jgi:Tfp pilus assembly protein PilP
MAKTKKIKNSNLMKSLLTIGGILALIQVTLIFYFSSGTKPTDIKVAIEESLAKQSGLTPKAKEQLKLQLALNHFQAETGTYPNSLNELVPTYFDSVPNDPETGKVYAYQIEAGRFYLGDRSKSPTTQLAANKADQKTIGLSEQERLEKEQEALIASLDENVALVSFVYDPKGKRDPFRPYDATPVLTAKGQGLQGYDLGQLRLTAVVDTILVTIEDQSGKGYIARKGDKVGLNNGEIVEILPGKVKILETSVDFTGKEINRVIEMELRNEKISD